MMQAATDAHRFATRPEDWTAQEINVALNDLDVALRKVRGTPRAAEFLTACAARLEGLGAK